MISIPNNNIGITNNAPACRGKTDPVKECDCKTDEGGFSFFKDVMSNIAPVLKYLN